MKKEYKTYAELIDNYGDDFYKNIDEIQKSVNKNVNGDILLREYMGILGLTDKDLEGSMSDIRAKIRDNKISKIIK
jgi:DNA-binding ferritin-like protein (Dps family)